MRSKVIEHTTVLAPKLTDKRAFLVCLWEGARVEKEGDRSDHSLYRSGRILDHSDHSDRLCNDHNSHHGICYFDDHLYDNHHGKKSVYVYYKDQKIDGEK